MTEDDDAGYPHGQWNAARREMQERAQWRGVVWCAGAEWNTVGGG